MFAVASVSATPLAEAKCPNPGPPRADNGLYYWDGSFFRPGQNVGGIYAQLFNTTVWVEPSYSTNFAAQWVGVHQPGPPGTTFTWAQVGWIERRYGERHDYYEYFIANAYNWRRYKEFNPQPIGDYSYYTTLFDVNTRRVSFQIDGATVLPPQAVSWTATEARASGEIDTLATQMPGGYAIWAKFRDQHTWYAGAWRQPYPEPFNSNSTYFGFSGNAVDTYIFDWQCYD
jgi:hypothetical protein